MRYIRTKDGKIFEYAGKERTPYGDLISADGTHYRYDCVLEEADTIEELCDCFVALRPQPKGNDYYILHRFSFVKENCLNGNEVVYGAIWTDKGLIYRAKMNSKGELELL